MAREEKREEGKEKGEYIITGERGGQWDSGMVVSLERERERERNCYARTGFSDEKAQAYSLWVFMDRALGI